MRWDLRSTICRPRRSWVWSHYWGSAVPRRRILLASDIVHGDEGATEEPLSPVRKKMVGLGFLFGLGRYEGKVDGGAENPVPLLLFLGEWD